MFILGAGAMSDYEFPIAWRLKENVINYFAPGQELRHLAILEALGFSLEQLDRFREALRGSGQNSVDAFLEEQTEFLEIGIATMSMVLIKCERPENLYAQADPSANWLRNLLVHMRGTKFNEFRNNQVSFVTFNYDRSLEYFLCRALANTFGKSEEESGEMLDDIPLIHLHGRLGFLPWQGEDARPYEPKIDAHAVQVCMRQVKVVNRNTEINAEQFGKAKELLAAAERVYLLGVGFNNDNLSRLGIMELSDNKAKATGIGLRQREYDELHRRFGQKLEIRMESNCIDFLRDHVSWN